MRSLRQWHHYLGVFFAPMIIFFAFTGALQTFNLHEAKGYGGASPPSWIAWMASIHKDQEPPRERGAKVQKPAAAPASSAAPVADHDGHHDDHAALGGARRPSPLPLKIFVTLLAMSLIFSTGLGVIIALNNRTMRARSISLLIAGAMLPCMLLWI